MTSSPNDDYCITIESLKSGVDRELARFVQFHRAILWVVDRRARFCLVTVEVDEVGALVRVLGVVRFATTRVRAFADTLNAAITKFAAS